MNGWISRSLAAMMVLGGMATSAAGQLAAPNSIPKRDDRAWKAADLTTESAKAVMVGNSSEALRLADAAIQANSNDGWGYYDRAEALQALKRTDDAVTTYREAQRRFTNSNEEWGKSVAIYGEARAFADAGRCADARDAYERYATFVQASDSSSAQLARRYASSCTVGQPPSQPEPRVRRH